MCRGISPYLPSISSRSTRRGSRMAVKLAVPSNRHGRLTVQIHKPWSKNPVRTEPSTRRASIAGTSSPENTRTVALISQRRPARLAIGALYARPPQSMVLMGNEWLIPWPTRVGLTKPLSFTAEGRNVFKPRGIRGRACFLTHPTPFIQLLNSPTPPSSR